MRNYPSERRSGLVPVRQEKGREPSLRKGSFEKPVGYNVQRPCPLHVGRRASRESDHSPHSTPESKHAADFLVRLLLCGSVNRSPDVALSAYLSQLPTFACFLVRPWSGHLLLRYVFQCCYKCSGVLSPGVRMLSRLVRLYSSNSTSLSIPLLLPSAFQK